MLYTLYWRWEQTVYKRLDPTWIFNKLSFVLYITSFPHFWGVLPIVLYNLCCSHFPPLSLAWIKRDSMMDVGLADLATVSDRWTTFRYRYICCPSRFFKPMFVFFNEIVSILFLWVNLASVQQQQELPQRIPPWISLKAKILERRYANTLTAVSQLW